MAAGEGLLGKGDVYAQDIRDCILCGACIAVCPAGSIGLEDGRVVQLRQACIRCGQCEAVCPAGAMKNDLLPQDRILELPQDPPFSAEQAERFLRARRSIRHWLDEPVPQDLTRRLLDIGRYAPTGSNTQGVSYIVVQTPEKMEQLRALTMEFYRTNQEPAARSSTRCSPTPAGPARTPCSGARP